MKYFLIGVAIALMLTGMMDAQAEDFSAKDLTPEEQFQFVATCAAINTILGTVSENQELKAIYQNESGRWARLLPEPERLEVMSIFYDAWQEGEYTHGQMVKIFFVCNSVKTTHDERTE